MKSIDQSRMKLMQTLRCIVASFAMLLLAACQQDNTVAAQSAASQDSPQQVSLEVLKSPTCACCELWIDHMSSNGFMSQISHPQDLTQRKLALGIAPQYQSCHTAISQDGYVFEGHVPAHLVQQFLQEKPANALGLAVPGMPLGSPGMEMGDQFQPYDVMMLMKDGSAQVYASITTQDQQY